MKQFFSFYPYFPEHITVSEAYLMNNKTGERMLLQNSKTQELISSINGLKSTGEILNSFGEDSMEVLRFLYNNGYLYFSREAHAQEHEEYHLHTVDIEITKNCNLRCVYCFNNSGHSKYKEMNVDEWIEALDILKSHGVSVISFTGGDPFVKEGFDKILKHAINNFQVHISTNGILLEHYLSNPEKYQELIQNLKRVWYISISLDSMNPSINDAFRGHGTHSRIVRAIILARAYDIPVEIGIVDHKLNHNEKDIIAFAKKVGASVSYTGLEVRGRAKKYNLDFLIPDEYKVSRSKAYDETKFEISCPVLYGEVVIQPDGYFIPCLNPSELFEKVSSLFTKGFHVFELKTKRPSDIPFLKLIKEARYVNCPNPNCPYLHEACGVCLVLRYYYNKHCNRGD